MGSGGGDVGTPSNTPPSITITSPSSGASFTSPANVTVSWTASDPDGDPLSFSIDCGNGTTATTTATSYTCTYSLPGTYTIAVTASDGRGGTGSDSVSVTVNPNPTPDTTRPSITSFAARPSSVYVGNSVTLSCSATDDRTLSKISIYKDSGDVFPIKTCTTSNSSETCSTTVTYSSPGIYKPKCIAVDAAGNVSSPSYTTVSVSPAPACFSDVDCGSTTAEWNDYCGTDENFGYWYDYNSDNIFGTIITECNNTCVGGNCQICTPPEPSGIWRGPADIVWCENCASPDGDTDQYSCSCAGGTWYTDHCCGDDAGEVTDQNACPNGSYFDENSCTCVRNEPPSITITSPSSGASFTSPANVTVSWTASDPDGDPLSFSIDCGNGTTATTTATSYTCTYSLPGTYTIAVTASDGRGGTGSDSVYIYVLESDTQPPTILKLELNVVDSSTNSLYSVYRVNAYCEANDNTGVSSINIFVEESLASSCTNTSSCYGSKDVFSGGCYLVECNVNDLANNTANLQHWVPVLTRSTGIVNYDNWLFDCNGSICHGIGYVATSGLIGGCLTSFCIDLFNNGYFTIVKAVKDTNTIMYVSNRPYKCELTDAATRTYAWVPIYFSSNYLDGCVTVLQKILCTSLGFPSQPLAQQEEGCAYYSNGKLYYAPINTIATVGTDSYVCEYDRTSYTFYWRTYQRIGTPQPIPVPPGAN